MSEDVRLFQQADGVGLARCGDEGVLVGDFAGQGLLVGGQHLLVGRDGLLVDAEGLDAVVERNSVLYHDFKRLPYTIASFFGGS